VSTTPEPTGGALPPGLLVHAGRTAIAAAWPALVPLQPVAWDPAGLVCAPRAGGADAAAALAACPLPSRPLPVVPGWPDPPAAMLGGWYVRGPDHAPAPPGVRELVQAPGEGFGPCGHVTTAMCLAALPGLPAGPAVDLGCGSGLLGQAWARLGRGPVVAVDLEARAVAQARASAAAAGLAHRIRLRTGPPEVVAGDVAGAVLLANLPADGHYALLACMHAPPVAAVLSGLRPAGARRVVAAYRAHGLRPVAAARRGGWERWVLAAAPLPRRGRL
jgi:SAM-dependent methyltransferase